MPTRHGVLAAVAVAVLFAALPTAAVADPMTPSAAPAAHPLAVALPAGAMLTLPGGDGFRDVVTAVIMAPSTRPVSLTLRRGTRTAVVARAAVPVSGTAGPTARVAIHAGSLSPGSWQIAVAQGTTRATASHLLRVGSGVARTVTVVPARTSAYPRSRGRAAQVTATVRATDETGAGIPVTGVLRLTDHGTVRTVPLRRADPATGTVSVSGLREGTATLQARVSGPAGAARSSGSVAVRLLPTVIRRVAITRSWPTVQPVIDDQLDSVTFSARGWSSSGTSTAVTGSITLLRGRTVVRSWPVRSTDTTRAVWDGRVGGRMLTGRYVVKVVERGPEGVVSTASTTVTVTDVHLPYRIRVIARLHGGNQQGFAIGSSGGVTRMFVGVDVGGGSSRIDEYRLDGGFVASSPPLAVGHGAEIAVGADGLLYVANGGPVAGTRIAVVDPDTWTLLRTIDLAQLGPNAMIATQPGGGFVVFAGRSGGYTITPMTADGVLGASVPVPDEGVPQGLEVVQGQVWLFSSLVQGNRITKLDPSTGHVIDTLELAMPGEGEGEAIDPATGEVYVGCHGPNRFGVLERVVVR